MSVDDFSIILQLHSKADADFEIQRFQRNFFPVTLQVNYTKTNGPVT